MRRGIVLAVTMLTGCASLVDGRDYRIDQGRRIIFGRSPGIVENICLMRGVRRSLGERVIACYSASDDVIVLLEGAQPGDWDWEHEMRHRRGV